MYSRQELADGFRHLGVAPGDTLMVHASVRAVGEVAGGPDQIHLAIKDALTTDGMLMMYASCPRYYDEIGRGHLDAASERELIQKLPAFDAPEPAGAAFRASRGYYLARTANRGGYLGRAEGYLIESRGLLAFARAP
jgi:aminoglycoside N3'-acetyltransferase